MVNYLLRKLELDYHRNTVSESYSCGTRRKLSTALAMIGNPQILLLVRTFKTLRHLNVLVNLDFTVITYYIILIIPKIQNNYYYTSLMSVNSCPGFNS